MSISGMVKSVGVGVLGGGALLLLLAVTECAWATESTRWDPIPNEAWLETARPDSGGGDAIVLLEQGDYQEDKKGSQFTVSRRIRVFTEAGREAATVEQDYLKSAVTWAGVRARSVREDGTATELDPSQIITTTILKSGGIEFNRTSFIVPGVELGCIIEYSYSLVSKDDMHEFSAWRFQSDWYTCESRFRWVPRRAYAESKNMQVEWILRRIPTSRANPTCVPNCHQPAEVSFVAYAIPGSRSESWTPPRDDSAPRVYVGFTSKIERPDEFWSGWKHFLDLVATEFGKRMGALEAVVKRAQARSPDTLAALAEVHDWLRDHVRSTAEPSWEELQTPRRDWSFWGKESSVAALVERAKGSPYEINLAFAASAQRMGLEAVVLLVRDRREGSFDPGLFGWLPTEAVTAIRSKGSSRWQFCDPASRFALFGNIPWYLRGGRGLVAGAAQELVIRVPPEEGVPGDARWKLDLRLDASGSCAGKVTGAFRGEQGRSYREELWESDPARWPEFTGENLAKGGFPQLDFTAPLISGSPDSALEIHGQARYPGLASVSGSVITIPVERFTPWCLRAHLEIDKRTQNVFFRFPRREAVTVDLHLPAGAEVEDLPKTRTFSNKAGTWRTTWTRLADGVRFERVVDLRVVEAPPREATMVRDLFDGLADADQDLLVVRKP